MSIYPVIEIERCSLYTEFIIMTASFLHGLICSLYFFQNNQHIRDVCVSRSYLRRISSDVVTNAIQIVKHLLSICIECWEMTIWPLLKSHMANHSNWNLHRGLLNPTPRMLYSVRKLPELQCLHGILLTITYIHMPPNNIRGGLVLSNFDVHGLLLTQTVQNDG